MKRLFLFSLLILGLSNVNAQMVVNDPTMLAESMISWGKQLDAAAQQFNEMQTQTKVLKEGIDAYKKVNSNIVGAKKIKNVIDNQVNVVSFLSKEINNATSFEGANTKLNNAYVGKLKKLVNLSMENSVELTDILSSGYLNLNDAERLDRVDRLDVKSQEIVKQALLEKESYEQYSKGFATLKSLLRK